VTEEPHEEDRARALAEVARDYPGWETWPGVLAGVVYARRPNSSPPLVVRAITAAKLRGAIEDAERGRGLASIRREAGAPSTLPEDAP
jgi:hypothetical protein